MLPFPLAGRYNTPIGQSKAKIKKERKISMKRLVAIILALLLLLVQPLALADGTPVSELWERAKATPIEASLAEKQSTLLLQHAMDGMFLNENFDDQFNVLMLAQSLPMLSAFPRRISTLLPPLMTYRCGPWSTTTTSPWRTR